MTKLLTAVKALFLRLNGEEPVLSDLSRIVLVSQKVYGGFTHEIILDLLREDGLVWIVETVEDIPVDEGWLIDPVAWLNEADPEELRKPSHGVLQMCCMLDRVEYGA